MNKLISLAFTPIFLIASIQASASTNTVTLTYNDFIECDPAYSFTPINKNAKSTTRIVFDKSGETKYPGRGSQLMFQLPPEFISDTSKLSIESTETKRNSKISQDFDILKNQLKSSFVKAAPITKECFEIKQTYMRSTISITAKNGEDTQNYDFITGPEERWGLSLDIPVNKIDELKFDDANDRFVEKETPASVYLGINYHLDDIYVDSDLSKTAFKIMVPITSEPGKALGLGISHEFKYLTLFVAGIYMLSEDTNNEGKRDASNEVIIGASFDLTHGKSWFE